MGIPDAIDFVREGGSIFGVFAAERHIPDIENLLFEHGSNEWNHLPEDDVRRHVGAIASGNTLAVIAASSKVDGIIGVVTYELGHKYPQYQPEGRRDSEHGYIAEAVVHPDFTGRDIGTALLSSAIRDLTEAGLREVYAKRHADNIPSKRMMEKAGMVIVDEFADPEIRPTGSRRTAVMRFVVEG